MGNCDILGWHWVLDNPWLLDSQINVYRRRRNSVPRLHLLTPLLRLCQQGQITCLDSAPTIAIPSKSSQSSGNSILIYLDYRPISESQILDEKQSYIYCQSQTFCVACVNPDTTAFDTCKWLESFGILTIFGLQPIEKSERRK